MVKIPLLIGIFRIPLYLTLTIQLVRFVLGIWGDWCWRSTERNHSHELRLPNRVRLCCPRLLVHLLVVVDVVVHLPSTLGSCYTSDLPVYSSGRCFCTHVWGLHPMGGHKTWLLYPWKVMVWRVCYSFVGWSCGGEVHIDALGHMELLNSIGS